MTVYDMVIEGISFIVTTGIFLISNGISLVIYGLNQYPEITTVILGFVGIYIFYKISIRIVKYWVSTLIMLIKMIILLITMVLVGIIYLRGSKFLNQDIPYFQQLISTYDGENVGEFIKTGAQRVMMDSFFGQYKSSDANSNYNDNSKKNKAKNKQKSKESGKKFQKQAKKVMNDYGIEIDESYLDYMNNFGHDQPDKNFVDHLEDTLEDLGIDLNDLMKKFHT